MAIFGLACLLIVWVVLGIGLMYWTFTMLMEHDYLWTCVAFGCTLMFLGLSALIYTSLQENSQNPCVAWGPPRTTWMMVGKVMTPITTTPCVQHQNEVEK
jgi:hypothetical protein